ncbi:cell wall-binding repeat-containing protein [Nostocoides sp. Soil756]|uniref:cell wall-binding repeat-containing protein n=1 Tax=Nostocoides sp. Soil756 TaxID=1736399 RepID=UPI003369E2BF
MGQYTSGSVTRLAGADRYSTSARISAATFAPGVDVAYVAKGTDFPDALSGGPLGGIQHAPVLLVRPTSIPTAVATELARLKPQRIVVLGGTGSISGSVATQLGSQSATPPAPSVTTKPASTQLVFGGVGDVATMSSTSGERVAHHVYGHLQDKYIPVGEMVTINAHTAPWTSVANAQPGSALYADMVRWARAIGGRSGTVLVAFGHEPEQAAKKNLGTPAEYKAAYQKVVAVFRSSGVRNVKWVFQATDWGFRTDSTAYNYAPRFYPGDAYVDIIGADAYNWHTCGHGQGRDVPLSTLAAPMVTFAKQHGKLASLPEFAANSTVDRAAWIKNGYTWLQSNREMFVAAFYFNHPPTNPANQDCQWPLSRSSEYREVSAVVADGWTTP